MKISRTDVSAIFSQSGVSRGDCIFLHSNAFVTEMLAGDNSAEKINLLFDAILDLIGPEGTLVLPTFTYGTTNGNTFDVNETKSDVGILTEYFRKRPDVFRSLNPIFSVAAAGGKAQEFANSAINDCFGEDTCFGLMYRLNSWIFTLGCSFNTITFIHYVDQMAGVDHRYFKFFPATIINRNHIQNTEIRYFVRDIKRKTFVKLDRLEERLQNEGKLKTSEIGRTILTGVRAQDFYNTALAMIKERSNVLIEESY